MSERRRQAASLVSLLVVTTLFVWACSSRGHEEPSVTTSGGAGSKTAQGGAPAAEGQDTSELGVSGTHEVGPPMSTGDGGSGDEWPAPDLDPGESGGKREISAGGSGSRDDGPAAMGGTLAAAGADAAAAGAGLSGAPGAGASSAGAAAAGGAPAVTEPVCDPADDHSTPDMVLPCDVSTALYVCRNCHGNPPVSGVHSYVTYADIKPNAAKIYGVIKSGTMPWPPFTLSAWQKSTALKWLGKNGTCAVGATKSCQ